MTVLDPAQLGTADLVARADGVVAGLPLGQPRTEMHRHAPILHRQHAVRQRALQALHGAYRRAGAQDDVSLLLLHLSEPAN